MSTRVWAPNYLEQQHGGGATLSDTVGVTTYRPDPAFQDLLSRSVRECLRHSERGLAYYDRRLRGGIKARLRERFVLMLRHLPGRIHVLTLPGLLFLTEKMILWERAARSMRFPVRPKSVQFHCLEWSRRVYRASIEHLPGTCFGLQSGRPWDLQTNGVELYRCCPFEDFEPPTGKWSGAAGYEAAWLDFTGPLTQKRVDRLARLWAYDRMRLLSVTFLRARGRVPRPVSTLLEALPGAGFLDVERYQDSASPMAQVFLWKGIPPKRLRGATREVTP